MLRKWLLGLSITRCLVRLGPLGLPTSDMATLDAAWLDLIKMSLLMRLVGATFKCPFLMAMEIVSKRNKSTHTLAI